MRHTVVTEHQPMHLVHTGPGSIRPLPYRVADDPPGSGPVVAVVEHSDFTDPAA